MPAARSSASPPISVWIVEDDVSYRDSIVFVLDHTTGLVCSQVFYAYEELESSLNHGRDGVPDVVLMDIGLPGLDGIAGLARLKQRLPRVAIVMLTNHDTSSLIFEALKSGASGYLLKDTSIDRLITAIHEAYDGGMLMPPPIAERVLEFFAASRSKQDYNLTDREMEVLGQMAEGCAHKQIADRLHLSLFTVENHLRSIYRKLHVSSGIEAVAKAYRERLL